MNEAQKPRTSSIASEAIPAHQETFAEKAFMLLTGAPPQIGEELLVEQAFSEAPYEFIEQMLHSPRGCSYLAQSAHLAFFQRYPNEDEYYSIYNLCIDGQVDSILVAESITKSSVYAEYVGTLGNDDAQLRERVAALAQFFLPWKEEHGDAVAYLETVQLTDYLQKQFSTQPETAAENLMFAMQPFFNHQYEQRFAESARRLQLIDALSSATANVYAFSGTYGMTIHVPPPKENACTGTIPPDGVLYVSQMVIRCTEPDTKFGGLPAQPPKSGAVLNCGRPLQHLLKVCTKLAEFTQNENERQCRKAQALDAYEPDPDALKICSAQQNPTEMMETAERLSSTMSPNTASKGDPTNRNGTVRYLPVKELPTPILTGSVALLQTLLGKGTAALENTPRLKALKVCVSDKSGAGSKSSLPRLLMLGNTAGALSLAVMYHRDPLAQGQVQGSCPEGSTPKPVDDILNPKDANNGNKDTPSSNYTPDQMGILAGGHSTAEFGQTSGSSGTSSTSDSQSLAQPESQSPGSSDSLPSQSPTSSPEQTGGVVPSTSPTAGPEPVQSIEPEPNETSTPTPEPSPSEDPEPASSSYPTPGPTPQ